MYKNKMRCLFTECCEVALLILFQGDDKVDC